MFSHTAHWYDALYSFKDYRKEAGAIADLIREHHARARTVLDVACGTAEHDRYLSAAFLVDGLDLQPEFVRIAAEKNPTGHWQVADMTDFHLARRYDVVMCLFSSIGYVRTLDKVVSALSCFREHLGPGGIILVEPWFTPAQWRPGPNIYLLTGETAEGKICRMNISAREGNLSVLDFHYLIGTSEGVRHVTERHELGLFTREDMQQCFEKARLVVSYQEPGIGGRGLYIARQEQGM